MNTTYGVLNNSSLIIDTDKLREIVRTILRSLPAGTKLIPVVKDAAYGMGMVGVARTLSAFPEIGCFAVANVSEGVTLRREGIRQDILIMGSTLPFQYAPAIECDLTVTVSRLGMVPELAEVCKAQSKPPNVQIKLETGMHRIGVEPGKELAALIGELKAAQEWVHVTGAFSHFAWPGNAEVCEAQYKKLLAGAEQLKAAGIPVPMCHISASESSELFPQYALDAVRIGRRLYMDHPKKPLGNIQEVVSWRSYRTNVKQRHAAVLVGGKRCPLLACCMDQCFVDVTGVEDAKVGDEITFFGYDSDGNFLSSQETANLIGDDEGCGLTSALMHRVARVFH